jgi:hypothetical protein
MRLSNSSTPHGSSSYTNSFNYDDQNLEPHKCESWEILTRQDTSMLGFGEWSWRSIQSPTSFYDITPLPIFEIHALRKLCIKTLTWSLG